MNPELEIALATEEQEALLLDEERAALQPEAENAWRQAGLGNKELENFNFMDQYMEDGSFQPDPAGGVNLKNKHFSDTRVNGHDIKTGTKFFDTKDPEGLAKRGTELFAEGFHNTEHGPSDGTLDGVFMLAANHVSNGGTINDFDVPVREEVKKSIFQRIEQVDAARKRGEQLDNLHKTTVPEPPPLLKRLPESEEGEEPAAEQPAETLEDLKKNEQWIKNAKIIAEYEGDEYGDDELAEQMLQDIVAVQFNSIRLGALIVEAESGRMPPEVRQAYFDALQTVSDKYSMASTDYWQGVLYGVVTDPAALALGGVIGTAAKFAMRRAAVQGVMKVLQSTARGRVMAGGAQGAAIGGAEGALFGGLEEQAMQSASGQSDPSKVWESTLQGAAFGSIFGGGFGTLLSEPAIKGSQKLFRQMANNAEMGPQSPWKQQRGSFSVRGTQADTSMEYGYDFGVRAADVDRGSPFYSRLAATVNARWTSQFGTREHGQDPAKIKKLIQGKWMSANDDISEGFAPQELQDSGLLYFLDAKSNGGQKVTMREIDNFMFARQPRVNWIISSMDDYRSPESLNTGANGFPTTVNQMRDTILHPFRPKALGVSDPDSPFEYEVVDPHTGESRFFKDETGVKKYQNDIAEQTMQAVDPELYNQYSTFASMESSGGREANLLYSKISQLTRNDAAKKLAANPDAEIYPVAPPKYNTLTMTGAGDHAYKEMRFFIPYEGRSLGDIALRRFGIPLEQLDQARKADVQQIADFMLPLPKKPFGLNELHYNNEYNRFAHVRAQEYSDSRGGTVFAVNEIQNELHGNVIKQDPAKPIMRQQEEAAATARAGFMTELGETITNKRVRNIDGDTFEREDLFSAINAILDSSKEDVSTEAKVLTDFLAVQEGFVDPLSAVEFAVNDMMTNVGLEYSPLMETMKRHINNVRATSLNQVQLEDGFDFLPAKESGLALTLNRVFQHAGDIGRSRVAFPSTAEQMANIQKWPEVPKAPGDTGFGPTKQHTEVIPRLLKNKKFMERFGIKDPPIQEELFDNAGNSLGIWNIVDIDPVKSSSKGPLKPIMSITGAASTAAAVQQNTEGEM